MQGTNTNLGIVLSSGNSLRRESEFTVAVSFLLSGLDAAMSAKQQQGGCCARERAPWMPMGQGSVE